MEYPIDERDFSVSHPTVYLEKQKWLLCALHALNNLLQDSEAFSKSDLDSICESLSPRSTRQSFSVNPHRNSLGFGNYDVNVLMCALQQKKLTAIWFDRRKSVEILQFENIYGFILNRPVRGLRLSKLLMLGRKSLHWTALRKLNGIYYHLDSGMPDPIVIGKEDAVKSFIQRELEDNDHHLLVVISNEAHTSSSWLRNEEST